MAYHMARRSPRMGGRAGLQQRAEAALDVMLFGGGILMLTVAGVAIGTVGAVVKGGLEVAAETGAFLERIRTAA